MLQLPLDADQQVDAYRNGKAPVADNRNYLFHRALPPFRNKIQAGSAFREDIPEQLRAPVAEFHFSGNLFTDPEQEQISQGQALPAEPAAFAAGILKRHKTYPGHAKRPLSLFSPGHVRRLKHTADGRVSTNGRRLRFAGRTGHAPAQPLESLLLSMAKLRASPLRQAALLIQQGKGTDLQA
jgi:hypothetical protein